MYLADNDDMWSPVVRHEDLPGFAPQSDSIGYDNNNAPNVGGYYGLVFKPAGYLFRPV